MGILNCFSRLALFSVQAQATTNSLLILEAKQRTQKANADD